MMQASGKFMRSGPGLSLLGPQGYNLESAPMQDNLGPKEMADAMAALGQVGRMVGDAVAGAVKGETPKASPKIDPAAERAKAEEREKDARWFRPVPNGVLLIAAIVAAAYFLKHRGA